MCFVFGLRRGTLVLILLLLNGLSVSGFSNEIAIAGVALMYWAQHVNGPRRPRNNTKLCELSGTSVGRLDELK
jgi:hypothetical protein